MIPMLRTPARTRTRMARPFDRLGLGGGVAGRKAPANRRHTSIHETQWTDGDHLAAVFADLTVEEDGTAARAVSLADSGCCNGCSTATHRRSVDVPTGLGKTSVMALWLIALAEGAELPRRLVYVVDRRAVVDQATRFAEQLRRNMPDALASELHLAEGTPRAAHLDPARGFRGQPRLARRPVRAPQSSSAPST